MKYNIIEINSLDEYPSAAARFVQEMGDNRIFAFYGNMGVGKTTFIKSVCEAMGVQDAINSPTFAIVNEYEDAVGNTIYHFDFYRIKELAEVYNMGYEEYFDGHAYCFIEWPELIEELLPEEAVKVCIHENDNGTRTIKTILNEE